MAGLRFRDVTIILKREYLARIRSKGFWISTIALPLLMAAWLVVPTLVMSKTKSSQRLALVDVTGQVAEPLIERLSERDGGVVDQVAFEIELVKPAADPTAQRIELDRRVLAGEIQAWVWIDATLLEEDAVEYHAESVTNFLTQEALAAALTAVIRRLRLEEQGYDAEEVGQLMRSIDLDTVRVSEEGSRPEGGLGGFALAIGAFMVLYMMILIYGNQVLLGVLDEKGSRVMEVLVSTVRPFELMLGKLLGIGFIGLTQLGIWIVVAVAATAPGLLGMLAVLPEDVAVPTLSSGVIVNFFVLFLLGYFLYASFYAMVGSAFNDPQEAQQLSSLAVVFVVMPWIFFMPILNDPDSTLAVVTSLIPVFTPFLMMLRVAIKTPPTWQILLSYVLTAAACLAMMWISARVYRIGILMYGKKPTLKELWRWARHG